MNKYLRVLLTWILVTIIALSRGMVTLQAHDDEDHINPLYDLHFDIDGKANQGSGIGIYEIHDYTQHDDTVWPEGFNLTEHTQANDFVAFYEALNGVTITAADRSAEGKYFDGWEFLSIQINHGDIRFIGITAHWTCTPPNTAPQANSASFSVNEDAIYNGLLTGNDFELDPLTFSKVTNPTHGTLTVNPNGTFTYDHDGSETLTDSFTFRVFDGFLYSTSATVSITVNPVNDAPIADDDSFTVAEGGTYGGNLTGSDVDLDPLTFSVDTNPTNGSVIINPNGSFSYVHNGSETSSDSFTFKVYDGTVYDYATVSITVTSENDPPVTSGDTITVNEGASISNHPFEMNDPEGNTLVVSIESWPVNGLLTDNGDGTFTYQHDGTETTSDSFTFKVFDGQYYSNESTVNINITPVNDAPTSNNFDFYLAENATINELVFGNDSDSALLTYERIGDPSHGSLTFYSDGTFTYIHDGSESTYDSFTYRVYDGALYSGTGTVNLYISNENDAPVANDDAFIVDEGSHYDGTLSGFDADGDGFTFEKVTDPSNGSVVINSDGTYTYTHNGSETTSDSFTFRVWDGQAYSSEATVTVTIDAVNDAPVALDGLFSVDEGSFFNDQVIANDAELDLLSFEVVVGPSNGTLDLHSDGTFTYTHNGSETISDTFTFRAYDGLAYSNIATATIIVNPVNDAPVAYDDTFSLNEGGTVNDFLTGFDIEGNPLSFSLISSPTHGYVDYDSITGEFTYIHNGGETSLDSLTFIVNDGSLDSVSATITFEITNTNDAPLAYDGSFSVNEGATHSGTVTGSDEESAITYELVSGPAHDDGSFTLNSDGTFTYVNDGNEFTSDTFTFRTYDGALYSDSASVLITIVPVNDLPVVVDDTIIVDEGDSYDGTLLATDNDMDTLSFRIITEPVNGILTLGANGSYTYLHNGSETSTDSFTFVANDSIGDSNIGTISIDINPVNDGPVALNSAFTVLELGTRSSSVTGTDPDSGSLVYSLIDGPDHGTIVLDAAGHYTYVQTVANETSDSFTFSISDGLLTSNVGTVTITITNTNEAPTGIPEVITVGEGGTVGGTLAGLDPDGDALSFILLTDVANGTLVLNPLTGAYTYTHNGGESTSDLFTFRVYDGEFYSAVISAQITIIPANDDPVALDGEGATDFETTLTGSVAPLASDSENDPLTYSLVNPVTHGTLEFNADGTFTYTPEAGFFGEDSFTYRVFDGSAYSNAATYTITVSEEVVVEDDPTPLATLIDNLWWILAALAGLILLFFFLRPNLKYTLYTKDGKEKVVRRHLFNNDESNYVVSLNNKGLLNLIHVDIVLYKSLAKKLAKRTVVFELMDKPIHTVTIPEGQDDAYHTSVKL